MNVVDFSPALGNRYTFWSGLTGGCFLAMAYFGTDQSQVQRYLSGRSVTESRLGLLFNGLLKVPMQFLILFVGVMVFVFYQFNPPPLFFNEAELARVATTPHAAELRALEAEHRVAFAKKRVEVVAAGGGARRAATRRRSPRRAARVRAAAAGVGGGSREGAGAHRRGAAARRDQRRRLHLPVVRDGQPAARPHRPAAGGHPVRRHVVDGQRADRARAAARVVDFYRRSFRPDATDAHYLRVAKIATGVWGAAGGGVRRLRLAGRQPDPGGQHPRLALLRHDPGDLPGRLLLPPPARHAGVRGGASSPRRWSSALWLGTKIGFLWFNVIGCAAVLLLSSLLNGSDFGRNSTQTTELSHEDAISTPDCRRGHARPRGSSSRAPRPRRPRRPPAAPPATRSRPTSSALLDDVQKKILSLEDAIPQDKFKWRPAPGVRSVSEAFLHIAYGNYGFTKAATGKEPPADVGWETDHAEVGRPRRPTRPRSRRSSRRRSTTSARR